MSFSSRNGNFPSMLVVIFTVLIHDSNILVNGYSFTEELLIEALPNLNIHFNFQFKAISNESKNKNFESYGLFPKQFGDIMSKFKIEELSLKMSQATWKYDEWGMPVLSAPTGNELWAVFSNDIDSNLVDTNWLHSSRAISGLFGLSINLQDNPNTVAPVKSIQTHNSDKKYLRYASIPNEIVCTENLTPWIKLLPCGKTKGIARLLKNSHKVFESRYLSTGLHFKKICTNPPQCNSNTLELKQTLSLVYNSELILNQKEKTMWSLQALFGQKLDELCPVADVSNVYMDLGVDGASNLKSNDQTFSKISQKEISVFDLRKFFKDGVDFNPTIILKKSQFKIEPLVQIHRYIADTNERNFYVKTSIKNNHNKKLSILYFDTLPWYFRIFLNSLIINKDGQNIDTRPKSIHFVPGLDRKRAHKLEIELDIEPKSDYLISFRVESAYLKWDEFPPDTNHGFYINPALISIKLDEGPFNWPQLRSFVTNSSFNESLTQNYLNAHRLVNIYTETLLMNLPLPDFSMPYNVICLVSTVVAIAFGSLHNFTTKKFKFMEPKTFKEKMIDRLKQVLQVFKRK